MEIFTEEFKNELSKQLNEITFESKKENKIVMSESEIVKAMQSCFKTNPNKEENKKSKKFKVHDVVYWGERKGIVTEQHSDKDEASTVVCFEETGEFRRWDISFTKDGRFLCGTPIVLSHTPYKLKMKKIK
jgi:hypothetical protein